MIASADESLTLARLLRDALDTGVTPAAQRPAALQALLHDQVCALALGRRADGTQDVLRELVAIATTADAAGMRWHAPTLQDGRVVLVGESPADRPERGYVLTVRAQGSRIIQLAQQRTAPRPAVAAPLHLPQALRIMINGALEDRHPMLLAHVDSHGQPTLSFRGSLQVHGDDALSLWVRNPQGGFISAIRANPRVAMMYRNEQTKATYQLKGRARVADAATERQAVYDAAPQVERDHDFAMAGAAVIVALDSVEGYAGLGPGGQIDRIRLMRSPAA